jgi:metallophosphoesterase superfamily enzyme
MELKMQIGESYLEFCNRVLSNYKQYGFATARDCFKELTGIDMFDNSRKTRSGLKNIQKAYDNEYYKKFELEVGDIVEVKKEELNDNKNEESIVLSIGDIHSPFEHKDYLNFCKKIYKKYNCNKVIFLGDIIDNHVSSFHETDIDGHSGALELELAKKVMSEYHKAFPNAMCCIGNHDAIPNRKAFSSGISKTWIKPISEVLNTPSWVFADHFIIDNVKYTHGTGRQARQRSLQDMISVVQAHYHSTSYIENYVGADGTRRFAMQVGCGINIDEYAFAYGRNFAKPHLNVAVIINGKLPIIEFMDVN